MLIRNTYKPRKQFEDTEGIIKSGKTTTDELYI